MGSHPPAFTTMYGIDPKLWRGLRVFTLQADKCVSSGAKQTATQETPET